MHVNTAERNLPLLSELPATVINSKQKCWSGDAGKGQTHMFTHTGLSKKKGRAALSAYLLFLAMPWCAHYSLALSLSGDRH